MNYPEVAGRACFTVFEHSRELSQYKLLVSQLCVRAPWALGS